MLTNREKLTAQAQKFIEKGQYDKAIREYLKIVAEDEKDVRTWLKIGDLYVKAGQKPEAAQTYQKVAQFYSDQGFYLKAVAVFKQIIKIDPRLLDVNLALADLYRQLGLTQDAITQYEAVAGALLREGRAHEAVAAHRSILELDPENVAQRIKLAELYSKQEMYPEAVAEFSQTAAQLKVMGRVDDYLKVAERLLFHDPDNRAVARELAARYLERGDARRALTKLQASFKHDPRDMDTLELLAQAFLRLEQQQKCISVLREMARLSLEAGRSVDAQQYQQRIQVISAQSSDAEVRAAGAAQALAADERAPLTVSAPSLPAVPATPPSTPPPSPGSAPRAVGSPPALRTAVTAVPGQSAAPPVGSPGTLPPLESGRNSADGQGESREEEIARIITEADVFTKYGLYQKAVDHLKRVLERQPALREVRERLYEIFEQIGQPAQAIAQLWELVDQASVQEDAARYLGEVLRIDPDNRAAVVRWRQIRTGGTGDRYPAVGADGPSAGSAPPPVDAAGPSSVSSSQPRAAEPPERTAVARQTADNLRPVYEMTRQGLRERGARSADASACYDLGLAYRDMGLFADAINELRKALHSSRLEGPSRMMIGVCLVEQDRSQEAVSELQRSLAVAGLSTRQEAEAYYFLGRAYERLSQLADALASYEQSLRLDGTLRDTRARLSALKAKR